MVTEVQGEAAETINAVADLTPMQRAKLIMPLMEEFKDQAKERQKKGGRTGGSSTEAEDDASSGIDQYQSLPPARARSEAARSANVGENAVARMMQLEPNAISEVMDLIDDGLSGADQYRPCPISRARARREGIPNMGTHTRNTSHLAYEG